MAKDYTDLEFLQMKKEKQITILLWLVDFFPKAAFRKMEKPAMWESSSSKPMDLGKIQFKFAGPFWWQNWMQKTFRNTMQAQCRWGLELYYLMAEQQLFTRTMSNECG